MLAWLQLLSDRRLAPFFEGVNMMRLVVKQVTSWLHRLPC